MSRFIFDRGISRTHWKSVMLEQKLNPLREALGLLPRNVALTRNQYDKEVVDALRVIDFSELDTNVLSSSIGWSNMIKYFVLNFAGLGLTDVDAVGEDGHDLLGHPSTDTHDE